MKVQEALRQLVRAHRPSPDFEQATYTELVGASIVQEKAVIIRDLLSSALVTATSGVAPTRVAAVTGQGAGVPTLFGAGARTGCD
jgi:hypothetical protein